jgi:glutamate racemase
MLKVLIFDSGVGGLSISHSLFEVLPQAEQILLSDNAYFPYGEMAEDALVDRVTTLLTKAASQLQPDCIVVACNTVSTIALEKIRTTLSIPVIGVVPAIKPAAEMSSSKVIGLLATPATVERSYTADLVNNFADDCILISVGTTRLVEIAEQRLRGEDVDEAEVAKIVELFIRAEGEQQLDTVVLGCTHFPLISDILQKVLPESITLVDSSIAIARQAKKVLQDAVPEKLAASLLQSEQQIIRHHSLLTKDINYDDLAAGFRHFGFNKPELFNASCSRNMKHTKSES